MRYFLSWLLLLAWGLWIGGQATLVLLIVTLFRQARPTAIQAGPHMFPAFERYQLILAGVAIVASALLAMVTRRKMFAVLIALFIAAGAGGIVSRISLTPKMVELWRVNRAESPEFKALHRQSEAIYNVEFVLLLLAGILLPAMLRGAPRKESEDYLEKGPPGAPADRVGSA